MTRTLKATEAVFAFAPPPSDTPWYRDFCAAVDALIAAVRAESRLPADQEADHYVDWGSGELLAMTALDRYPIDDGKPKSTSVVYRIHQLGRAYETATAELQAMGDNRDKWQAQCEANSEQLTALRASRPEEPRYLINSPGRSHAGLSPTEVFGPCLYQQVKPCKEMHPNDPDDWCGWCLGRMGGAEPVEDVHHDENCESLIYSVADPELRLPCTCGASRPTVEIARQEWQPIATVPKDGTPVLVWISDDDLDAGGYAIQAEYVAFEGDPPAEYRDGWCNGYDGMYLNPDEKLTHWMPLPSAPGK